MKHLRYLFLFIVVFTLPTYAQVEVENIEDDDDSNQELFDSEVSPPGEHGFIEPAVVAGCEGGSQVFIGLKLVSDSDSQMIVNYTLPH